MPCIHEASLFYSQSIIASLSSLVYLPATSSQLPRQPTSRRLQNSHTAPRVSLSLSAPLLSQRVVVRAPWGASASTLCRIYLYDFRFFRLLQSPIPRDTNDEWPGFSRLTSFKSVPRSFAAFFSTSVVALRPSSVQVKYARLNAIELKARERTI